MPSKIDIILESVGAIGKYQWLQITLIGFAASFCSAFHFLAIVFHSITPEHRCQLPGWENDSYAIFDDLHNQTINQWIPVSEDGKLDSCKIYGTLNGTVNTAESDYCDDYVFDKSVYWGTTLNMEFGMFCADSWAGTTVKVVFTAGLMAGAIGVGILADRFGRKYTLIVCTLAGGITGVVAMFSVNYYMFAALRFIIAFCFVGAILIGNMMVLEITGPSGRGYAMGLKSVFWPAGVAVISLMAYYIQDWNWFQLSISIFPVAIGVIMIFFLNETPHFLTTQGRHEEAEAIFKRIADMNGKTLKDDFMDQLEEDEEAAVSEKLKDILKAPVLIRRTIMLFFIWFITGASYYGLSFNVTNLTGSVFLNNFIISGVADLPVTLFVIWSQRIGRKIPSLLSFFVGSIALITVALVTAFLDTSRHGYILLIVSMIGKLGIANVFMFIYLWSGEMVPTTLRFTLVGLCSLMARVGSIISPIIVDLSLHFKTVFGPSLGALIFGIAMLVGTVLTFFLPETNNKRVPQTIAEANVFMTKRKVDSDGSDDGLNTLTPENMDEKTHL